MERASEDQSRIKVGSFQDGDPHIIPRIVFIVIDVLSTKLYSDVQQTLGYFLPISLVRFI